MQNVTLINYQYIVLTQTKQLTNWYAKTVLPYDFFINQ
ncbi:hypothetical protein PISS_a2175 [Pseudoalteromonas issachenkonii]|uniref:Uncharacterized protein n=1 Tax=Pseudoalteromonas issachenkonii TaxID=152297 RepID=A0ABN5C1M9_9GAMM|nr:hypothetical protein PISS_a2175 [Pseudoalteromonas issachenkonii]